ncbi:MAG TPA: class I SAM-dependent methyltransferase [Bradyrhizobium sp.]|nr:class I SAM-dependent methyltransferase [Bradyrhizobium sp.]
MRIGIDERIRQWDDFAESYTRMAQGCAATMLDVLAAFAKNRPAIELGAGAGRVCIPLARRGVPMTAAEFSPQMISRMREAAAHDGVSNLEILQCDFSSLPTCRRYGLAYCVDNAFFALCSEEEQLRCFRSVANLLDESGFFVIEAGALALEAGARVITMVERFRSGGASTISLFNKFTTESGCENGPAARFWRLAHYYIPVTKFDEYANKSMLTLAARWSNWSKAPYDGNLWSHISVWCRDVLR